MDPEHEVGVGKYGEKQLDDLPKMGKYCNKRNMKGRCRLGLSDEFNFLGYNMM
jgi:hypothetical protein